MDSSQWRLPCIRPEYALVVNDFVSLLSALVGQLERLGARPCSVGTLEERTFWQLYIFLATTCFELICAPDKVAQQLATRPAPIPEATLQSVPASACMAAVGVSWSSVGGYEAYKWRASPEQRPPTNSRSATAISWQPECSGSPCEYRQPGPAPLQCCTSAALHPLRAIWQCAPCCAASSQCSTGVSTMGYPHGLIRCLGAAPMANALMTCFHQVASSIKSLRVHLCMVKPTSDDTAWP